MKLTQAQVEQVNEFVASQGIQLKSLREDIVDHICCVIEYQLDKDTPFNTALQQAANDLAPDGLHTIERKTIFLLNSKRILLLKRVTYGIGFIGAAALTIGITMKLLNYPGANTPFTIGFLVLLLIFVPLSAIDKYKVMIAKALSERLKLILGTLSAIIIGSSGLFKVLHLQGAEMLLMLGSFILLIGFLPFLFFSMYKKSIS